MWGAGLPPPLSRKIVSANRWKPARLLHKVPLSTPVVFKLPLFNPKVKMDQDGAAEPKVRTEGASGKTAARTPWTPTGQLHKGARKRGNPGRDLPEHLKILNLHCLHLHPDARPHPRHPQTHCGEVSWQMSPPPRPQPSSPDPSGEGRRVRPLGEGPGTRPQVGEAQRWFLGPSVGGGYLRRTAAAGPLPPSRRPWCRH